MKKKTIFQKTLPALVAGIVGFATLWSSPAMSTTNAVTVAGQTIAAVAAVSPFAPTIPNQTPAPSNAPGRICSAAATQRRDCWGLPPTGLWLCPPSSASSRK